MKRKGWTSRWVEGAIGLISPRRAAIRAHLRRMATDTGYESLVLGMMRARGYRAAKDTASTTPWLGMSRSADAEILTDLPKLRNRTRELNRDDPIGSGLTGTFVHNIVGTGMRAQARTKDPDTNTALEAVWNERKNRLCPVDRLTQGQYQRMKCRKKLEDGEILIKQTKRTSVDPVWFELIEADRLGTPPAAEIAAGHEVRDGVEKDANGIPVAYWLRRHHPGDSRVPPKSDLNAFDRVEAAVVRHARIVERPGQSRGVPFLHAVLQDIRDLDLLLLASIKRVQISACLAVFFKSPFSVADTFDATAEEYGYKLDQQLEPGMIWKMMPEEEMQTLLPNFPTPELEPFIIMLARRIGAAVGVSWQVVLKDFSKSTYSSARTDLLETWRVYDVERDEFSADQTWEWVAVMMDARLRGETRLRGISDEEIAAVRWIPNTRRWVDPLREVKAIELAMKLGLTTLQEECAKLGLDYEEVIRQRQVERKALKTAGLIDSGGPSTGMMENLARGVRAGVPVTASGSREDEDESEIDVDEDATEARAVLDPVKGRGNGRASRTVGSVAP